ATYSSATMAQQAIANDLARCIWAAPVQHHQAPSPAPPTVPVRARPDATARDPGGEDIASPVQGVNDMHADEPANDDRQTIIANGSDQTASSDGRPIGSSVESHGPAEHPTSITFREACEQDLPAIAELLSDDMLGA